jgi:hypothetical protein
MKVDTYLAAEPAIEAARQALGQITKAADVGAYLGIEMEGDRVATLSFACERAGYAGWRWAVTMARVPRARHATVSETELLPGPDSLLAPTWVPWADRIKPGDIGPGDVLPHVLDDPRLEPGYESVGADEDQLAIWELGLGRARVLSPEGRDEAAERWYGGKAGPDAPEALRAQAQCSTCGFITPLAGSYRALFGVCTNRWSPRDGSVVSYDHGCGAHSETDVARGGTQWPEPAPMIDDSTIIPVDLTQ